ncbi:MAG: septum site determining protein, partial [Nocardioides sp.]|uniref:septum site-determining protein Ssd n=1 Tax=Nocardioides sp. TaxID=35761 RepID=UPI0039E6DA7F
MTPALVITADPLLLDELARLAAAAGVRIEPTADVGTALRTWSPAPLVLIGADLAEEVARLAPPRRDGVCVLAWGPPPEGVYRPALSVGAQSVIDLPGSAELVAELLTDLGEAGRPDGVVLGVLAGSGGAGATTFAAALASLGAERGPTVLLDTDPLGPGADRVLGLEEAAGVRWSELGGTAGRLGARALRE